jgi:transposase-like protein
MLFPLCYVSILFNAQPLHQYPPDIVEHCIDFWVSPFHGVRGMMEPRGCVQDRLTGRDWVAMPKRAFFNSRANDGRA